MSKKCLTSIDQIGVGATTHLSYKGETTHSTAVGGFFSIIIYSVIIPMIFSQLYPLFKVPEFGQQYSNHYIPHEDLSIFNMTTGGQQPQAVVAAQLYSNQDLADTKTISDYVMPIFYQQEGEAGVGKTIPSVPCLEMYATGSENLDSILELHNVPQTGSYSEWLCPDTDVITISGSDYVFGISVVTCLEYAAKFGLDNSRCATDEEVSTLGDAQAFHANANFIKQYFNPVQYYTQGDFRYATEYLLEQQLIEFDHTSTTTVQIQEEVVNYQGNRIYDFWFTQQQLAFFESFYQGFKRLHYQSGSHLVVWLKQSDQSIENGYMATNLFDALSDLGGVTSVLFLIQAYITGGYQEFVFNKSMMETLFTQKIKSANNQVDGEQEDLKQRFFTRVPYMYSYRDHFIMGLLKWITCISCCCCIKNSDCFKKRKRRADQYEQVCEQLSGEFDVLQLILRLREIDFLKKSFDKKERMRAFVATRYSDQYCVDKMNDLYDAGIQPLLSSYSYADMREVTDILVNTDGLSLQNTEPRVDYDLLNHLMMSGYEDLDREDVELEQQALIEQQVLIATQNRSDDEDGGRRDASGSGQREPLLLDPGQLDNNQ